MQSFWPWPEVILLTKRKLPCNQIHTETPTPHYHQSRYLNQSTANLQQVELGFRHLQTFVAVPAEPRNLARMTRRKRARRKYLVKVLPRPWHSIYSNLAAPHEARLTRFNPLPCQNQTPTPPLPMTQNPMNTLFQLTINFTQKKTRRRSWLCPRYNAKPF